MIESQRGLNPQVQSQRDFFTTNQVVLQIEKNGDQTYYLPCYVRFLLKQLQKVSVDEMQAVVSGTLLFSFYYGNMDRALVEEFIGQNKTILLEFNQQDSILLKEDKGITMKQNDLQKTINFSVRQHFRTNLQGNVFFTPFQTLDLYMSVAVRSVQLPRTDRNHRINIKFNCMDNSEAEVLSHGQKIDVGYYRIASFYMESRYSNSRKNPFKPVAYFGSEQNQEQQEHKQHDENVNSFQYAHFRIPVYKHPAISILTIFIPIWILGLIGLIVFFQQPGLSGRLATVAVLALAFVAFIPTINNSIPQSPTVKLVDILILMHLAAVILLIVQSFNVRKEEASSFNFQWNQSKLFLACLILNGITFFTVMVLFLVHKCFWERKYTKVKKDLKKKISFSRKGWRNRQCDMAFLNLVNAKIKNL